MFFDRRIISHEDVKNPYVLDDIPESKLFISESRYAYHIDEIIDYFKGNGEQFLSDYQNYSQAQGILRDFANRERPSNLHVFSPTDIQGLLKYPGFEITFEEDPAFDTLQNYSGAIQSDTLSLMKRAVAAANILENQNYINNPEGLGEKMGAEVHDLYSHLTKHIDDYPESEQEARSLERYVLQKMTSFSGVTPYGQARGVTLLEDLSKILQGECSAGFNRQLANLVNIIESHKNYEIAKKNFELKENKVPGAQSP